MKIDHKKYKKIFVHQQDYNDCGAACLLSIIKYYNGSERLERIKELSGTCQTGTTLLGLLQAAQQFDLIGEGLEANSVENLSELDKPAILHVVLGDRQHYIVFCAIQNGIIWFIDPEKGYTSMSTLQLDEVWKSKALLIFNPGPSFKNSSQSNKEKIKWIINLFSEDRNSLITSIFLGAIIAILGISTAVFSQKLIDELIPSGNYQKLIGSILLLAMIFLLKSFFDYFRGFFLLNQNKDFNSRVVKGFFSSLLYLPKAFFNNRKIGEIVSRMNDIHRLQSILNRLVGGILIDVLIVIISFIALMIYSPITAGFIIIASILCILNTIYFHSTIFKTQEKVMASFASNESNYVDTIQGIDAVKLNNKEKYFIARMSSVYDYLLKNVVDLGTTNIKFALWSDLILAAITIGVISFTSSMVFNKQLQMGEMVAILTLAGTIGPALNRIIFFNIQIQEGRVAFDRMYEFTSMNPEFKASEVPCEKIQKFNSLSLQNITFGYPGRNPIIRNLSMNIFNNEFIAILGESGRGKSTLINLISRYYLPEMGEIFLNDEKMSSYHIDTWRDSICVVSQNVKIFNASLVENVCLNSSEEEKIKAFNFLNKIGFHKYFSHLPDGYFTIIGEDGVSLSGGQQQLVAFARAVYRNPKLLILDEATAALDGNTEKFIIQLLQERKREMAILMVTHRIKAASCADRVYIMEDYTIKDFGTPEELMSGKNVFSEYFKECGIY